MAIDPDEVAAFQYTGGTTGLPKAAMLTHRNLVANALQIRHWVPDLRVGEEVILALMPFFHAYGTTLCLHLAVLMGAKQVLLPASTPARCWRRSSATSRPSFPACR